MGRAPCCDKEKVKRGPWAPEEDIILKNYIHKHGTAGNWIALPHKAGLKRCGKSCRLRWLNYLRPDIKHGGFTEDEDIIICNLYNAIGSRWSVMASQLPGRTDNDIKNYWNTKVKKKFLSTKKIAVFSAHQITDDYITPAAYFPTHLPYQESFGPEESQFPLPNNLINVSVVTDSTNNYNIISSTQDVSSFSGSSNSLLLLDDMNYSNGGQLVQDHELMIMEMGFESSYSNVQIGSWFSNKL